MRQVFKSRFNLFSLTAAVSLAANTRAAPPSMRHLLKSRLRRERPAAGRASIRVWQPPSVRWLQSSKVSRTRSSVGGRWSASSRAAESSNSRQPVKSRFRSRSVEGRLVVSAESCSRLTWSPQPLNEMASFSSRELARAAPNLVMSFPASTARLQTPAAKRPLSLLLASSYCGCWAGGSASKSSAPAMLLRMWRLSDSTEAWASCSCMLRALSAYLSGKALSRWHFQ
mmetsp:Transcript_84724/g.229591  ORF Transcript_84724/g.229591 Transcript_84724/m.229591 type:complete len:227 (-) Transcript_84724:103-783(-)